MVRPGCFCRTSSLADDLRPCGVARVDISSQWIDTDLRMKSPARSVLCEGGGLLSATLISDGVVDEIVIMTAGTLLGSPGMPCVADIGVQALAHAPRYKLAGADVIGGDLCDIWVSQQ